MSREERHKLVLEGLEANTAFMTMAANLEAGKKRLVDWGFVNKDGTLAERYGGSKQTKNISKITK